MQAIKPTQHLGGKSPLYHRDLATALVAIGFIALVKLTDLSDIIILFSEHKIEIYIYMYMLYVVILHDITDF